MPGGGAYSATGPLNAKSGEPSCLQTHLISATGTSWRNLAYEGLSSTCNSKDERHETNSMAKYVSESMGSQKELPAYLKQRLKARGILKDEKVTGSTYNSWKWVSLLLCNYPQWEKFTLIYFIPYKWFFEYLPSLTFLLTTGFTCNCEFQDPKSPISSTTTSSKLPPGWVSWGAFSILYLLTLLLNIFLKFCSFFYSKV